MALVTETVTSWGFGPESGFGNLLVVYQDANRNVDHFEVHQELALFPVRLIAVDAGLVIWDRTFAAGQVTTLLPGTDFPAFKWNVDKATKTGSTSLQVAYPA